MLTAIDLETRGLIDKGVVPEIICWSWCNSEGSGCSDDFKLLKQYLREHKPAFHNAKFDVAVLRHHGYEVKDFEDTMLLSYVYQSSRETHNLASWGKEFKLKKLDKPWEGEYPTKYDPSLEEYAKRDAEITYKLYNHLYSKLSHQELQVYYMEKKFCEVIMEFEALGLPIDEKEAYEFKDEIEKKIVELNGTINSFGVEYVPKTVRKKYKKEHPELSEFFVHHEEPFWYYDVVIQEPFNPNSTQHKVHALKTIYNWQPMHFTKKNHVKLDASVMSYLADIENYELARVFKELATYTKVLTSFVEPMLNFRDSKGFVHGNYNQARTITGRLSSSKPNLQNLPARGELGKRMRSLIKSPHPDLVILQSDLSNIEARVLAFYLAKTCNDTSLTDVFISGEDFHQANADRWGLTRDMAKTVLYLTLYGGTYKRLAVSADISETEAQAIQDKFNSKQPSVQRFKNEVNKKLMERGYVKTLFGRRIKYNTKTKDKYELSRIQRQSFNAVLQGTAADILKQLLIQSYRITKLHGALMMATVHDEILILAHKGIVHKLKNELSELWNSCPYLLPCPIAADFNIGERWSEVH